MKTILINYFTKNGGAIARLIAGAVAAGITALVARYGFELTPDQTGKISAGVALAVQGLIGEGVTYYQAQLAEKQEKGIAAIQQAIAPLIPEIQPTGKASTFTVEAVKAVAAAAASPEAMPTNPPA